MISRKMPGVDHQEHQHAERDAERAHPDVDGPPADLVGQPGPSHGGEDADRRGDAQRGQRLGFGRQLGVLQVGDHVGDRHRVAGGLGDAKADAAHDVSPVLLITLTIGDLTMSPCSLTSSNTGDSGTLARMIRPTMTRKMLAKNGTRHAQSPPRCTLTRNTRLASSRPDRETGLHHAGVLALLSPRGVLVAHQDRATPFGAERHALDDAHGDQQDRREDADGGVGGQQADRRTWPDPSRSARPPARACGRPCRRGDRR